MTSPFSSGLRILTWFLNIALNLGRQFFVEFNLISPCKSAWMCQAPIFNTATSMSNCFNIFQDWRHANVISSPSLIRYGSNTNLHRSAVLRTSVVRNRYAPYISWSHKGKICWDTNLSVWSEKWSWWRICWRESKQYWVSTGACNPEFYKARRLLSCIGLRARGDI